MGIIRILLEVIDHPIVRKSSRSIVGMVLNEVVIVRERCKVFENSMGVHLASLFDLPATRTVPGSDPSEKNKRDKSRANHVGVVYA